MKKSKLVTILALIGISTLQAQSVTYLDAGNVNALISSDGVLFQDILSQHASYEVPKGSNKQTIYSSSFWMMDKRVEFNKETISGAFETYGLDPVFNIGPVDIVNQKSDTSLSLKRIWSVYKSDVENHIQNWNSSSYTTPNSILNWPGNGNSNTAQNLAPYEDLDNDNIYEPNDGEYPIIKGDQAVFFMLNDYRDPYIYIDTNSYYSNSDTLVFQSANLEIHAMFYAYANQQPDISNSVFASIKIINRSSTSEGDLNNFKTSVWTDFDIGYAFDDYIGTDTIRSMVYGYNGDNFDESSGRMNGYGEQLAAQGVKFLNTGLSSSMYYNNDPSPSGSPSFFNHFANYQRSVWKDGNPVYYGGNGYFSQCADTSKNTKYMFSGDPTLLNDTSQWTEANACLNSSSFPNPPGDRRILGTAALSTQLHHGDTLIMDYAYVFARDNDSSTYHADPVGELYTAAENVQAFYDSLLVTDIPEQSIKEHTFINIYPNPSGHVVNVETELDEFEMAIFDINGRKIKELHNQKQFSVKNLDNGIYLIQITAESIVMSRKLLVQQ